MPETRATAYDSKIEGNVIFTQFDAALNWVRKNSLWPMPMGLACCAIELMAAAASRFDIARFGAEVMRFSPRQCDVMIVAGTVTYKMALATREGLLVAIALALLPFGILWVLVKLLPPWQEGHGGPTRACPAPPTC